jgi:hypothetical protein
MNQQKANDCASVRVNCDSDSKETEESNKQQEKYDERRILIRRRIVIDLREE